MKKLLITLPIIVITLFMMDAFLAPNIVKAYFVDDNFANPKKITANSFEVSYDNISYTLSYPFEHSIDRIIKIKNLTDKPIDINLKAFIKINGKDEEVSGWPQPLPEYFMSQEEKEIILKYEFNDNVINATENGKAYDYPFRISLNRKDESETSIQFTLSNKVLILSKDKNAKDLPTNAKINGRVIDETTSEPIRDAHIRIRIDLPIATYEAQTDAFGNFNISVPAYQRKLLRNWIEYSVIIDKEGYEDYNVALAPKENEDLKIEAKMKASTERADYKLVTKYDTGLPTARVDFSKDGKYFATVPFHSSEKIDFIEPRAYLHLFNTEGNLVCRYKLDNEIPTVSISGDGGLIATVYRQATDNWMGGNDVVLLDHNCKELWRYSGAKQDSGGPSEVKISPDGKYIAVGTYDGRVYLLDIQNRKSLWNYATGNGQVRQILFNENSSGVYFGSDPNLFHYKINGDFDWKTNIGSWPYSMTLSNKYIFVGAKAGRFLSLIDKVSGAILWRYPIAARPDNMLISPDETYFIYQSSNGGLAIKNAIFDISGNLLFNLQGANAGTITDDSKYIVFYNGNSVQLVNRRGSRLWQQQLDIMKWPAPRGAAYISRDKTKIIVADAVNGNVYFFEGGVNDRLPNNQVAQKQEAKNKDCWMQIGIGVLSLFLIALVFILFKKRYKAKCLPPNRARPEVPPKAERKI